MQDVKNKTWNKGSDKIKQQIDILLKLQKINQDLDALVQQIEQLKEEASQEEKKYLARKSQYDKHFPYLQKSRKEYAQLKSELQQVKERITQSEEKKKIIKTVKEFKAVNKEIDTLHKENAIKENDLMTKGEELEFKEEKMKKISDSIEEIREAIEKKKEDMKILIKERRHSISKCSRDKEKLETKLFVSLVKAFGRIYKNKNQLAVVSVERQICQGCYAKIPMQVEIDVKRRDRIIFCPSCSRVLYLDNQGETIVEEEEIVEEES